MARAKEILENIGAAVMIAGTIVFRPLLRPRYSRWGADDAEVKRALPGDERVPHSKLDKTLAITINAPAHDVWPWIAQIGQERGGLYSYELLENMIGCKMRSADRIVPEWELKAGDNVRFGPKGYPVQKVIAVEPNRSLVMAGADPKTEQPFDPSTPAPAAYVNATWTFYLDQQADGATRLLSRERLDYAPDTFGNKLIWRILTDPMAFTMTRKMLLTIKQRVEAQARSAATL
jgi:hypothetical protein